MPSLLELDDLAFDLIFSHLRYNDLLQLTLTCKALKNLVANAQITTLNCTLVDEVPITVLPYPTEHYLVDQQDWRVLTHKTGRRRSDVYLSNLYWTSKHKFFDPVSLKSIILDGSNVNVLDIIYFITASPRLAYLSVRFCLEVDRLLLQNFLHTLKYQDQRIALERLDVLGIHGIPYFEPIGNGTTHFNEMEIELTGAGPEFDYQDRWREDMYDFQMTLSRVPTIHKRAIRTDVARCSQAFCRNFPYGAKELADPTIEITLSRCILCRDAWKLPICRTCIASRSCKICGTFVCPKCYNNDNDIELQDYSTSQLWIQDMTNDVARGGRIAERDCAVDIELSCLGSAKGALMMQHTHRHMAPAEVAKICLAEGYL